MGQSDTVKKDASGNFAFLLVHDFLSLFLLFILLRAQLLSLSLSPLVYFHLERSYSAVAILVLLWLSFTVTLALGMPLCRSIFLPNITLLYCELDR